MMGRAPPLSDGREMASQDLAHPVVLWWAFAGRQIPPGCGKMLKFSAWPSVAQGVRNGTCA
jgi:hypothetical protein